MWHGRRKSRSRWQKAFITDVLSRKSEAQQTFSKIILRNPDLLRDKHTHTPGSLFRFYAPTPENIADIKSQKLWLSHPRSFNDPFDCQTGYDVASFEKHSLLESIKTTGCVDACASSDGFTADEVKRLSATTTEYMYNWYSKVEEYDTVLREVLKGKSESFTQHVQAVTREARRSAEEVVEELRQVDIRVACFSALKRHDGLESVIHMWSHYAAHHRGFCVEYDMRPLAKPVEFVLGDHEFYGDRRGEYTDERLQALIQAGLFPVIYAEGRVNVSKTRLQRLTRKREAALIRDTDIEALLYKTYIVKSGKWSYEKEWRLILDGDICSYYGNRVPFPYIRRVFLGCRMDAQTIDTMIEVVEGLGAEVRMMVMDNRKFLLEDHDINMYKWERERSRASNPFW
ncbi:DUF2971 domain-containing protein [Petrachloros mirabilis]